MLLALAQNGLGDDDENDTSPFSPRYVFVVSACAQAIFLCSFWRIWRRHRRSHGAPGVVTAVGEQRRRRSDSAKEEAPGRSRRMEYVSSEILIFVIYFAAYTLPAFTPIIIEKYTYKKVSIATSFLGGRCVYVCTKPAVSSVQCMCVHAYVSIDRSRSPTLLVTRSLVRHIRRCIRASISPSRRVTSVDAP